MTENMPPVPKRPRIEITLDDLAAPSSAAGPEQPEIVLPRVEHSAPTAPAPPLTSSAASRPARAPNRGHQTRSGVPAPILIAGITIAVIWRLLVVLIVVAGVAAYIWGGSNAAHDRCILHRLGAPGLVDSIACILEH
jgi:hypothetical protein